MSTLADLYLARLRALTSNQLSDGDRRVLVAAILMGRMSWMPDPALVRLVGAWVAK